MLFISKDVAKSFCTTQEVVFYKWSKREKPTILKEKKMKQKTYPSPSIHFLPPLLIGNYKVFTIKEKSNSLKKNLIKPSKGVILHSYVYS